MVYGRENSIKFKPMSPFSVCWEVKFFFAAESIICKINVLALLSFRFHFHLTVFLTGLQQSKTSLTT